MYLMSKQTEDKVQHLDLYVSLKLWFRTKDAEYSYVGGKLHDRLASAPGQNDTLTYCEKVQKVRV